MLRENITHIRVREMAIKIQPTKKTRRCLEATVNECLDGLEVSPVVREDRRAPAASERRTGNFAMSKTLIKSMLASNSDEVLQIADRQINPANFILVNSRP